jgi:hypothetical protein
MRIGLPAKPLSPRTSAVPGLVTRKPEATAKSRFSALRRPSASIRAIPGSALGKLWMMKKRRSPGPKGLAAAKAGI